METKKLVAGIFILFFSAAFIASNNAQIKSELIKEYNLAGERIKTPQFFILETTLLSYNPDGSHAGKTYLKLYLKCAPDADNGKNVYRYTCSEFSIMYKDSSRATVPALENWSYIFGNTPAGFDEKGQVFGIDHSKFDDLSDSRGKPIPPEISYWLYNSFIDFHAFCNVFAQKVEGGNGIQDLHHLNQKIIHASANSEPPVDLGSNVEKGSYFRNGEVTLTFTGLGIMNDAACAIVTFDSGESSFKMKMKPMPNMEITTVGSSHYKGNLFINMNTFWVEKVIMDEFVLSETTVPNLPNKITGITERNTVISNVSEEQFEKEL